MADAILPDVPVEASLDLSLLHIAVVDIRSSLEDKLHDLLDNDSIAAASSISATYVQSEVQDLASKIDLIVAALEKANIISVGE